GAGRGQGEQAARLAVLLGEQGLGGAGVDLDERLARLGRDGSSRAKDARALAARWMRDLEKSGGGDAGGAGLLIAEAFPERIARARGPAGEYQLASGRGVFLDPTEALARERWLAVAELGGGAARDRILSAARLDEAALVEAFASRIETRDELQADAAGRLSARRVRRLGRITLDERRIDNPDPTLIAGALLSRLHAEGLDALPWSEASHRLRRRLAFLAEAAPGDAWPDLSDAALLAEAETWAAPLLAGRTSLAQVDPGALHDALRAMVSWPVLVRLEAEAPDAWTAPTGTRAPIDYAAEGGPRIEVRVQELFGLTTHPAVAGGRVPLTLALLSPARRPIQTTKDLPGFWKGSWAEVRKEMRGRYPKHPWPEDPAAAPPTTRAKPRG
ncbi:MAG: ATP-dependent helicase HrpB, partial [Caulobacteraceae bacterium]|nr:ATP-dependent helicase HrpB [Caulobacteraceae bacterium]